MEKSAGANICPSAVGLRLGHCRCRTYGQCRGAFCRSGEGRDAVVPQPRLGKTCTDHPHRLIEFQLTLIQLSTEDSQGQKFEPGKVRAFAEKIPAAIHYALTGKPGADIRD